MPLKEESEKRTNMKVVYLKTLKTPGAFLKSLEYKAFESLKDITIIWIKFSFKKKIPFS